MDADGGGAVVADAGRFGSLLEAITVVVLAFDCSWAGPVAARWVQHPGDLVQDIG
jgi:hypothetical protein